MSTDASPQGSEPLPTERRALGWAALFAVAAIWWVVAPVALGVLLGVLLAFMMRPVFGALQKRFGLNLATTFTVVGTSLALIAIIAALGWMIASRGTLHMTELIAALGPDAPGGGVLKSITALLERVGIAPEQLEEKARGLATAAAGRIAVFATALFSLGAESLLGIFFMMLSMHFVLKNPQLVLRVAKDTLPLRPEWTLSLASEFRRVGKATLLGTLVTGLAQGLLAAVGFIIGGVPDPLFYGAVTALASLVPAVGTLLVWVPAGVVMLMTGHPIGGLFVLAWGLIVVVGVSDYVIRPRLIGGESPLPPLITFAALFGGVEAMGLKGLIVGPVLVSLAMAILRIWSEELLRSRAARS